MPRVLICVNTNPDRKHITIHTEDKSPCSHVFKQILTGNTQITQQFNSKNSKEAIVFAYSSGRNSFWVALHVSLSDININDNNRNKICELVKEIASNYGINKINFCDKCSTQDNCN